MSASPRLTPSAAALALIYLRESKAEQLDGYSPEAMTARCREKAALLGLTVSAVLIEDGKGDDWSLPKLWEAIRLAEQGAYGTLLTYDTSRLARDMGKRLWVKRELAKHGVGVRYATVDFAESAEGELHENVMGSFDQYERAKIGMRTANGIAGKLAEGHVIGNGRTPYGYEPVLDGRGRKVGYAPSEPEAGIVRRIVAELATETLLRVCDRLNADGVETPGRKGRWASGTIVSLLRNPVYLGEYRFGATTLAIEPLVERAAMQAARAGMARRRQDRRPRRPAEDDPFTLRGLVRCGHCDGALSATVNNGYRRYTCLRAYGPGVEDGERCRLPQVAADALELHAWGAVVAAMRSHCFVDELTAASEGSEAARRHASQVESVRSDIARLDRRIARAVALELDAEDGSPSDEEAKRLRGQAERERKDLVASLSGLEASAPKVLSRGDVEAMLAARDEILAGLTRGDDEPSVRRAWFRRLGVSGTVRRAADGESGVVLGRKHAYAVALSGRVGLSDRSKHAHGCLLLWNSSENGLALRVAAS
jgi:DNA invertase Pin-like site-specific DNA recombinase